MPVDGANGLRLSSLPCASASVISTSRNGTPSACGTSMPLPASCCKVTFVDSWNCSPSLLGHGTATPGSGGCGESARRYSGRSARTGILAAGRRPRGVRGAADARGAAKMEPISLILAALLAGVVTGAGQSASSAVQDAYAGLRDALKRRLAAKPAAQDAVEQFTRDPDAWKGNLEVHLQQAGAGQDQAILEAAASVLRQVDPEGASTGKYVVDLRGAAGVQVGDDNAQTNYFGSQPR